MLRSYHIDLKFLHLDKEPEILKKIELLFISGLTSPKDTFKVEINNVRSDIGNLKNYFVEIVTSKHGIYLMILDLAKEYKKNTRNLIINGLN